MLHIYPMDGLLFALAQAPSTRQLRFNISFNRHPAGMSLKKSAWAGDQTQDPSPELANMELVDALTIRPPSCLVDTSRSLFQFSVLSHTLNFIFVFLYCLYNYALMPIELCSPLFEQILPLVLHQNVNKGLLSLEVIQTH